MKPIFFSCLSATLLLTACASNPNNYSNNSSDLVPTQQRGILGVLNPTATSALSNNNVNINSNNTNFSDPLSKTNNPPMHLVQNQSNYTKSVNTEAISGPGFNGTSQSVSVSGFTTQVWKGSSHSSHIGGF